MPMSRTHNMFLTCFLLFPVVPASAREKPWTEVRSPYFRVLTNGSQKDARRIAREFEQMRSVFAVGFPNMRLDTGAPLLVLAPGDEPSMKALTPQFWKGRGPKPAGYFQHGWEKQFAIVRLDQDAPGAYQVVFHEYVHSLLHQSFRWLPTWLDEGLAEFYGSTRFEQSKVNVGAPSPRARTVQQNLLIPFETLLTVNPYVYYGNDESQIDLFYAESWALVHYLIFGPGMEQGKRLNRFYNQLQQGEDQKKAFEDAVGNLKETERNLDQYVNQFLFNTWRITNASHINEKAFAVRTLTVAETEAEIGGFRLWAHDLADARGLIEQSLKDDPKLAVAHENMGFLDFADGKDVDAAHEFATAYELDSQRYLSLYFMTMLSPVAQSDAPADQDSLNIALLRVIKVNSQFAPPYVQLARLLARQGNPKAALELSRKAEQLEPSRAGYHLLSGRILLQMGKGADAATFARYVAERWHGPDHNEAVEVWNSVPPAQRSAGDPLTEEAAHKTQTAEGRVLLVVCGDKDQSLKVVLERDGESLTFRSNGAFMAGYSDTLWYGADHFSLCHHLEGLQAVVRYKPSSEKEYSGDLVDVELREDLPISHEKKSEDGNAVNSKSGS